MLNLLYFFIINLIALRFLTLSSKQMAHPWIKGDHVMLTGPEAFWVLTFSTGLMVFYSDFGINLSAIRMLSVEVLCILGLFICKEKARWSLAVILYFLYLLWLCVGMSYGPSFNYGIRTILKYLLPFVVCLFASAAVRDFEVWMLCGKWTRISAVICALIIFTPVVRTFFGGVFMYATGVTINFIAITIFSLTLFFFTDNKKENLIWAILFTLPCFILVFRTSILGTGVALAAFSIIKWKLRALPALCAILVGGVIAVFMIPSLHSKMFRTDVDLDDFMAGRVTMEHVDGNLREYMWKTIEQRFIDPHPLEGAGTGSVQDFMYNNSRMFGGINVVHSDYVQIKGDNGLIGFYLYIAATFAIFLDCFITYWRPKTSRQLKMACITAGALAPGMFATMYSDNVVNYSMATLMYSWGFYGMMLGLRYAEKQRRRGLMH